MLAIEVEYLLGRAVATDGNRRDVAEWPPHPSRLFSALVDALSDDPADDDASAALRWLEQQPAPGIRASIGKSVNPRRLAKYFVPVNDELPSQRERMIAAPLPDQRTRQERYFPAVIPDDPTVQFVWSAALPEASQRDALHRLTRRVCYLGHSSSLVRVTLTDNPRPPTLVPADDGDFSLRVPGPGRLARLNEVHALRLKNESIQPPRGREQIYRAIAPAVPKGPFGPHEVLAIEAGPRLDLCATAPVIIRLREALLAKLRTEIPEVLSGHGSDGNPARLPHLVLLPLANVGHQHADGTLKGFVAVLPDSAPADVRERLREAFHSIRELRLGTFGLLTLEPAGQKEGLASLKFAHRYAKPSCHWRSVTPIALGQHPKPKKQLTEEEIVARDVEMLGLPRPKDIRLGRVSACRGAPMTGDFTRGGLKQIEGRLLRHAYISFDEEIAGPLVIGAGRFMGFGLCLPDVMR